MRDRPFADRSADRGQHLGHYRGKSSANPEEGPRDRRRMPAGVRHQPLTGTADAMYSPTGGLTRSAPAGHSGGPGGRPYAIRKFGERVRLSPPGSCNSNVGENAGNVTVSRSVNDSFMPISLNIAWALSQRKSDRCSTERSPIVSGGRLPQRRSPAITGRGPNGRRKELERPGVRRRAPADTSGCATGAAREYGRRVAGRLSVLQKYGVPSGNDPNGNC